MHRPTLNLPPPPPRAPLPGAQRAVPPPAPTPTPAPPFEARNARKVWENSKVLRFTNRVYQWQAEFVAAAASIFIETDKTLSTSDSDVWELDGAVLSTLQLLAALRVVPKRLNDVRHSLTHRGTQGIVSVFSTIFGAMTTPRRSIAEQRFAHVPSPREAARLAHGLFRVLKHFLADTRAPTYGTETTLYAVVGAMVQSHRLVVDGRRGTLHLGVSLCEERPVVGKDATRLTAELWLFEHPYDETAGDRRLEPGDPSVILSDTWESVEARRPAKGSKAPFVDLGKHTSTKELNRKRDGDDPYIARELAEPWIVAVLGVANDHLARAPS